MAMKGQIKNGKIERKKEKERGDREEGERGREPQQFELRLMLLAYTLKTMIDGILMIMSRPRLLHSPQPATKHESNLTEGKGQTNRDPWKGIFEQSESSIDGAASTADE